MSTLANTPLVSVLMSVYNGEPYLRQAIESILDQSFADFEFIIVDDGSQDRTWDILREYAARDARIVLIQNEANIGLTRSLNKGLAQARGKYIARQDADDVSLPERLELQVRYLEKSPQVGVLGSWIQFIDEHGEAMGIRRLPVEPGLVKWSLLFGNYLVHTTVMFRRALVDQVGGYAPNTKYAQDYELWSRMYPRSKVVNLAQVLVHHREHAKSIVANYPPTQKENLAKVSCALMAHVLGKEPSIELVINLVHALHCQPLAEAQSVREVARLIQALHYAYLEAEPLSDLEVKSVSRDAANRLFTLGHWNLRRHPLASLAVLLQAIRMDIRVPLQRVLSRFWPFNRPVARPGTLVEDR